jgi:hypothetical protein
MGSEGQEIGRVRATFRPPRAREAPSNDPEELFASLTRDPSVPYLWDHQAELLRDYHVSHINTPDVALELPTGAGKTLVGLLLAEFRRRTFSERVAYLCPTRQLAQQVVGLAAQYGVDAHLLLPPDYYGLEEYLQAAAVGVTTYSALFNNRPRINDPQTIVLDDSHAAESFIMNPWSVSIERRREPTLYEELAAIVGPALGGSAYEDLLDKPEDGVVSAQLDLLPGPALAPLRAAVHSLLDAKSASYGSSKDRPDWTYAWDNIRGSLHACNLFTSRQELLLRPLIAPTRTHAPFSESRQRIYMSATLGDGGELERISGVRRIIRLPTPKGSDRQASGRRLFLFPDRAVKEIPTVDFIEATISKANRGLILVPRSTDAESLRAQLEDRLTVLGEGRLENALNEFVSEDLAVLVLANRYDGIDLPNDDCRLLIMAGQPVGTNLQERFLVERLGMGPAFAGRLRTRVVQGSGRCSRGADDYAVVVALSQHLLEFCLRQENQEAMPAEMRAEIKFGLDNSKDRTFSEFLDLIEQFLGHEEVRLEIDQMIIGLREQFAVKEDKIASQLARVATMEVDFANALWVGNFAEATARATSVADAVDVEILLSYQGWWRYLAAQAAWAAGDALDDQTFLNKAEEQARRAAASTRMGWFARAARSFAVTRSAEPGEEGALLEAEAFERILASIERNGYTGNRFEQMLGEFDERISSTGSRPFELGLETLGKVLGFEATRPNVDAAPDGVWRLGEQIAIAFEAKSDETADAGISLSTVREAGTHAGWVMREQSLPASAEVFTVITTPRTTIDPLAEPNAADLRYVHIDMIRELASRVAAALRTIRSRAPQGNKPASLEVIAEEFNKRGLRPQQVLALLLERNLASLPVSR